MKSAQKTQQEDVSYHGALREGKPWIQKPSTQHKLGLLIHRELEGPLTVTKATQIDKETQQIIPTRANSI